MKKIMLLGASGSIGTQTLAIIKENSNLYNLNKISIGYNTARLYEILKEFPSIKEVALLDESKINELRQAYPMIVFHAQQQGILNLFNDNDYDIVLNAIVGFAGLLPSIESIKRAKVLALANKETMVVAGELIKSLLKEHPQAQIIPVDSEHCALFQCLDKQDAKPLRRLIITASGGAFRDKSLNELEKVTISDALNHPNWNMGNTITIDSATMLNKGLEVIEAHYLFNVDYDNIDVVIHYESIVHSMIEYIDSSIIAQLSNPNMKQPINYALGYPHRVMFTESQIDFSKVLNLTFKPIDLERFEGLALAIEAGKKGDSYPCVLNASKEVATNAFLKGDISFLDITKYVKQALLNHQVVNKPSLDELFIIDAQVRDYIKKEIYKKDVV
jgi:1-deoxy-D-xylulose-5-phosphate reductoisomerase